MVLPEKSSCKMQLKNLQIWVCSTHAAFQWQPRPRHLCFQGLWNENDPEVHIPCLYMKFSNASYLAHLQCRPVAWAGSDWAAVARLGNRAW